MDINKNNEIIDGKNINLNQEKWNKIQYQCTSCNDNYIASNIYMINYYHELLLYGYYWFGGGDKNSHVFDMNVLNGMEKRMINIIEIVIIRLHRLYMVIIVMIYRYING